MKNLLIRNKKGVIAAFKKGEGENLDYYRYYEQYGYTLEPTDDNYIRKRIPNKPFEFVKEN